MDAEVLNERIRQLKYDNVALKKLLHKHDIPYSDKKAEATTIASAPQKTHLSLQEKVALFSSLFKGIEDVFAKRWHSQSSDKYSCQPVCASEWNRELCERRNINAPSVPIVSSRH